MEKFEEAKSFVKFLHLIEYQREIEPLCYGVALTDAQESVISRRIFYFFASHFHGEEALKEFSFVERSSSDGQFLNCWLENKGERIPVQELYKTFYNLVLSLS